MSEETEATIKKSILVPAILLVLILIFHAVAGIHWIRTDKAMRGLDELDYLMFLQRFESDIADPNLSLKQKVKIAFWESPRLLPGFSFGLAAVSYQTFGRHLTSARLVSFLAFLGLILVLFFFGIEIAGPWCGLLSSTLFSFFPFAFINGRHFNLFAISAFSVTLALWLLVKSEKLTKANIVLLLGVVAGCAALSERGIPPLFLAGPAFVVFIQAMIEHGRNSKQILFRSLFLTAVTLGLTLFIGGPYLHSYFFQSLSHNIGEMTNPEIPVNPVYHYYFTKGVAELIGLPVILLFALFSALTLIKKSIKLLPVAFAPAALLFAIGQAEPGWIALWAGMLFAFAVGDIKHKGLLLAWIAVPLILFSLFTTKTPHYLFNLMPALALAIGAMIAGFSEHLWQKAAVTVLFIVTTAFLIFQFSALSFDDETAVKKYENLPASFQTVGFGIEFSHPAKGVKETADQILKVLPDTKEGGLLVHLPGTWTPIKRSKIDPPTITSAIMWNEQIEVWINYANPKIEHLILSNALVASMPWAEPNTDTFVWLPASMYDKVEQNPISQPFMFLAGGSDEDREMLDKILNQFPSLPGKLLAEIPFVENTDINITQPVPMNVPSTD